MDFVGGGTPYKANLNYWNGNIVWLSSQEIKSKYIYSGTYKITQKAIDDNVTKLVSKGTPLIVSRSGILVRLFPVSIPLVDVAINQDIKALLFDHKVTDADYVVGFLNAREKYILGSIVKTGTTVQSVNMSDLKKMDFCLPIYNEQREIGSLFKRIDKLIAANVRVHKPP